MALLSLSVLLRRATAPALKPDLLDSLASGPTTDCRPRAAPLLVSRFCSFDTLTCPACSAACLTVHRPEVCYFAPRASKAKTVASSAAGYTSLTSYTRLPSASYLGLSLVVTMPAAYLTRHARGPRSSAHNETPPYEGASHSVSRRSASLPALPSTSAYLGIPSLTRKGHPRSQRSPIGVLLRLRVCPATRARA